IHAAADQFAYHRSDRWISDLHSKADRNIGQESLQGFRLQSGPMEQGRPRFLIPDATIFGRRLLGPRSQDEEVENKPPAPARHFDDRGVAEELEKIPP